MNFCVCEYTEVEYTEVDQSIRFTAPSIAVEYYIELYESCLLVNLILSSIFFIDKNNVLIIDNIPIKKELKL